MMTAQADLDHCRAMIRTGSRSFHAASRLLPARVRAPALALYAFCRVADDAVDDTGPDGRVRAVADLRRRLDRVYRGCPRPVPADRAFAAVVAEFGMPRALPEALIEGFEWDAAGRQYRTLPEVRAYAARVASAVGAMMCVLMGVRDGDALARACDLGLAMQLTNIARDVGEDARAGRLYLPHDWLRDAGWAPGTFLRAPVFDAGIADVIRRLLAEADRLYARADAGIAALPVDCRAGIAAARHIYAGIGGAVARAGYDSLNARAHTSAGRKAGWMALALGQAALTLAQPRSARLHARPEPETAFLVDAARLGPARPARSEMLVSVLADLAARDRMAWPAGNSPARQV